MLTNFLHISISKYKAVVIQFMCSEKLSGTGEQRWVDGYVQCIYTPSPIFISYLSSNCAQDSILSGVMLGNVTGGNDVVKLPHALPLYKCDVWRVIYLKPIYLLNQVN